MNLFNLFKTIQMKDDVENIAYHYYHDIKY